MYRGNSHHPQRERPLKDDSLTPSESVIFLSMVGEGFGYAEGYKYHYNYKILIMNDLRMIMSVLWRRYCMVRIQAREPILPNPRGRGSPDISFECVDDF
jgi:hypothetical protein